MEKPGEKVIYSAGGSLVTHVRAVLAGVTYPIAAITSVRMREIPAPPWGWLMVILGVFAVFAKFLVAAAFLVVIGVLIAAAKRKQYVVVLTTAGGEKAAYKSGSEAPISAIVTAINEAIVERG